MLSSARAEVARLALPKPANVPAAAGMWVFEFTSRDSARPQRVAFETYGGALWFATHAPVDSWSLVRAGNLPHNAIKIA